MLKRTGLPTTPTSPTTLDQRILRLFHERGDGVVSGAELSRVLAVSRTAVWKHVKALQDRGYRITAVPSQGYRLLGGPDLLVPAEIVDGLALRNIASHILYYTETDSTNIVAARLAEEGATDGTVVLAEAQLRGKGRLGRQWASPAGVNIYCSVVLRPDILPVRAFELTFLSAVAVARTIERVTRLRPQIKWPNDILVNGLKVAGLLNEMNAETEKVHFVILGIGVNVNMGREQFPAELRHPASSLMLEGGAPVNRTAFLRELLTSLDGLYHAYLEEGFGPVREEWLARCNMLGRTVSVEQHGGTLFGRVTGIDENGALLITTADNRNERILAGDVTLCD
jgi:BirA family biotin operon repressor/biotin-[acetyl-CoA-carboxylase] ligase